MSTEVQNNTAIDSLSAAEKQAAIRAAFESNGRQMAVVLARKYEVSELEVVQAMPEGMAVELDSSRWEAIIRALEPMGACHVIVNNGSVTMECTGPFSGMDFSGPFFNVQNDELDMHIQYKTLTQVFAVIKPGHTDGSMTQSIQFFNHKGEAAFKVFSSFGSGAPSEAKQAQFQYIIDTYPNPA